MQTNYILECRLKSKPVDKGEECKTELELEEVKKERKKKKKKRPKNKQKTNFFLQ